jgi:hypothetical protein
MDDDEGGGTPRPSGMGSREGTPRPEGGLVPKTDSGDVAGTPRPVSVGGRTPARDSPAHDSQSFTAKRATILDASFSQAGSQMGSREGSADRETQGGEAEEGEDVEMGETGEAKDDGSEPDSPLTPPPADDTPQIVVNGEGDSMDTT